MEGRESSRRDDLIMFRMVQMPDIGSSLLSAPSPCFVFTVINAFEAAEPTLRRRTLAEFVTNSAPNYGPSEHLLHIPESAWMLQPSASRKAETQPLGRCRYCPLTKAALSPSQDTRAFGECCANNAVYWRLPALQHNITLLNITFLRIRNASPNAN